MSGDETDNTLEQENQPGSKDIFANTAYLQRRLPSFWKPNPSLWFKQIEAVFTTTNIVNQTTRYHHTVAALDMDVLSQVADIIDNHGPNPYDALKNRLIQVFGDSEHRRLTKLLEESQIGNQQPSFLLRSMIQQAGRALPEEAVKALWLRKLPTRIQGILAATGHSDVNKLAEIADKVIEIEKPNDIFSVRSNEERLQARIDELQAKLKKLEIQQQRMFRQRGRSPHRYRPRDRSVSNLRERYSPEKSGGLCFYHWRWKDKANSCTKPCTYKQPKNLN